MLRKTAVKVSSLIGLTTILAVSAACQPGSSTSVAREAGQETKTASPVKSLIPADRLKKIKNALPKTHFAELASVLKSDETLWYDHDVMTPSYQDSVGVNSNADWPRLVATGPSTDPAIRGLHDAQTKRWQFPFSVTAGTDKSSNVKIANFIHLPHENGKPLSIPIWTVKKNANRPNWNWVYPIGTMIGEVLLLDDNGSYLATEVRIRKRYKDGWATNVFRPFATAASLSAAIKAARPEWKSKDNLARMVEHLEDTSTLKSSRMVGKAELAKAFDATAGVDQLPPFNDAALVRELLTKTPFSSVYGSVWKEGQGQKSFAPTTTEALSIVPNNYQAHVLAVEENTCHKCHQDAGKKVSDYYDGLYLYGEVWGKDGIFSFHPFDESEFKKLRQNGNGVDGYYDNRKLNPVLKDMGIFENYDAAKHNTARYPARN
jgi:hypothetical protein